MTEGRLCCMVEAWLQVLRRIFFLNRETSVNAWIKCLESKQRKGTQNISTLVSTVDIRGGNSLPLLWMERVRDCWKKRG